MLYKNYTVCIRKSQFFSAESHIHFPLRRAVRFAVFCPRAACALHSAVCRTALTASKALLRASPPPPKYTCIRSLAGKCREPRIGYGYSRFGAYVPVRAFVPQPLCAVFSLPPVEIEDFFDRPRIFRLFEFAFFRNLCYTVFRCEFRRHRV